MTDKTHARRKAASALPDGGHDERWLDSWRDEPAYVLLGDPGSGKTKSLKAEAAAVGGRLLSAALIQDGLAELASTEEILFIDAVDEVRGNGASGSETLGAIGRFLRASGRPRFRIACREADWRGEADRLLIASAAPEGELKTLHLTPLSDDDIRVISESFAELIPNVDSFLQDADKHGVYELLRNPLLLELMISAVAENGQWPLTRKAVYEAACSRLAKESSEAHRAQSALQPGLIETILADAGTLCAILLLSGGNAISRTSSGDTHVLDLNALPRKLALKDPAKAIKSKVFTVEGDLVKPRHRTIAEYLGARALSQRVAEGLPLSRVLSIMQGHDGIPVEAMRGLCAWLTVHLPSASRQQMLRLDPVGFIVNGDAATLTHAERILTIEALAASAAQNRWFRSEAWVDHPFGQLATPDMAEVYEQELSNPDRSKERQAFIDCLLDALKHAPAAIPALCGSLVAWVEDEKAFGNLRITAYKAWCKHCPPEHHADQLRTWLRALDEGLIEDTDDRLLEQILEDAYPEVIQIEVLEFFRPKKKSRVVAQFSDFWGYDFIKKTPQALLPALGDAWSLQFPKGLPHEWYMGEAAANTLLCVLVELYGDAIPAERLYNWLGIGLDEFRMSRQQSVKSIASWLQDRPTTMKEIAAIGYLTQEHDRQGYKPFWLVEERLRGATLPADWIRWNMALASDSKDQDFVRWIISRAAGAAIEPPYAIDAPTADEVYHWVTALTARYPDAEMWLQEAWTISLEDWRAENYQLKVRHLAERQHAREQRKKQSTPLLEGLPAQPLPAQVLHGIALSYKGLYTDIHGETPEERVADFLGADSESANKALQALDQALARDDLPTAQEIIELDLKGREHFIRSAALLAAERACESYPDAWRSWGEELQKKLAAFWLTYGADEEPVWFKAFSTAMPELVAPILIAYAQGKLRRKGPYAITGLWQLSHDDTRRDLARLVLPDLLKTFPLRAHEGARGELNRSLLSGLHLLPRNQAQDIVRRKLTLSTLDSGQRISWLIAQLPYEPSTATLLVEAVGRNQRRVAILGEVLRDQRVFGRQTDPMPAVCIQHLIELLAPLTSYGPSWSDGGVSDTCQREEIVRVMLGNLGSNPSAEAGQAIQNLLTGTLIGDWRELAEFQLQAQQRLFREATFSPSSSEAVSSLLCNGAPANIMDLSALLIDHLRSIQSELRGDPSFQLRQFWKDDGAPRNEEECRDQLLAMLRPRLEQQQIDLQPESRAAAAKRMDLRATTILSSGRRFSLPIEAKKDNHSEVWTAWRTQLQALYANDPSAEGVGLYLIFWFGRECKRSPEGVRPTSASDLESQIRLRIPEADRSKLQVIVLDLSWPDAAQRVH